MLSSFLTGFAGELVKLAEHPVLDKPVVIEKMLEPGDILVTAPRLRTLYRLGVGNMLLRPALTTIQGTPFTHTAIYAGKGKVIDTRITGGVHEVPLKDVAKEYRFRALRVMGASARDRLEAVRYARSQIGKPFSISGMLRAGLPPSSEKNPKRQENLVKLYCSQLVANAYAKFPLGNHRSLEHVRPVDIQKSPLTAVVAELK